MESAIQRAYKLAKQLDNVEMEARIKGPILRTDTVKRLLRKYDMRHGSKYTEQRNKATSGAQTVVYRCIDGGNIIRKSKIKSFKCYNEWASIVVSTEVDIHNNEMLAEKHFVETTKTRYSKLLNDDTMQLDITYFHDDDTFQVEVEVLQYDNPGEFMECIRDIINALQDSPLYISRKKFDAVRYVVGGEGYYFSDTATMNKYGSIDVDRTTDFSLFHHKYQKPITLLKKGLRNIFRENTFMTPKLDGVRRFIVAFNGMVYDIDPEHMHVRLISNESPYLDPFPSIVDTEFVLGTYNIFDICVLNGWYVGNETLSARLGYINKWMESFEYLGNCVIKEYEKISEDNPIDQINDFYQRYRNGTFPIDGIIFVDDKRKYIERVVKWKEYVTIDLKMDENGTLEERIVANSIDTSNLEKRDDGTFLDGSGVYEFEVLQMHEDENGTRFDLKVLRFRDDKKKPNASKVIMNNISGLELRDIWNGYGCVLMRQYHNAVKRKMLKIYTRGCTVLDIGTGQGGDISKWRGTKKVYCVEPNDETVLELKRRLSEAGMKKHVSVIHSSISDIDKIQKRVKKVDVMTLFFAVNLFSQRDLDALVQIVDIYQPKHIIGAFLDRELIRFGDNSCFSIVPNDRSGYRIHLHGTRINQDENFFGLDQLEFVGYKLADSQPLNKGKIMSSNEMELSSMFRCFHFRK
jgi:hypothetical protein